MLNDEYKKMKKYKILVNDSTLEVILKAIKLHIDTIMRNKNCFTDLYPELDEQIKKQVETITTTIFNITPPSNRDLYKKTKTIMWLNIFNKISENLNKTNDNYELNFEANATDIAFLATIIEFYMRMYMGDYSDISFVLSDTFYFTDLYNDNTKYLQELRTLLLPNYVKKYGNALNGHYGIMNDAIPENIKLIAYPLWQTLSNREIWQKTQDNFSFEIIEIKE